MRQEIHFKGLSLTPDNHHAEVGALSLCAGAELHDGALRPSVMPHSQIASKLPIPDGQSGFYDYEGYTATLRFVHQGNGYTHFIGTFIKDDTERGLRFDDVYWYDEGGYYGGKIESLAASWVNDIQAVGNTLVFISTIGTYYSLWKEGSYTNLGVRPTFPWLQFSLSLDPEDDKNADDHFVRCSGQILEANGDDYKVKEDLRAEVTDQVMSRINHRISKICAAGCFYAPFLIRYCFRLYDGSMLWHSAPVLLFPLLQHPVTTIFKPSNNSTLEYYIFMQRAKLRWRCLNDMSDLDDWKDIIKSVDFFVTQQFSRIDTAGLIKKAVSVLDYTRNESFLGGYYYADTDDRLQQTYIGILQIDSLSEARSFELPEADEETFLSRIANESSFFLLASVEAVSSKFSSSEEFLDFPSSVLQNITVQEHMKDDYRSSNGLRAKGGYVYNRRLNIYDVDEKLLMVQPLSLLFPSFNATQGIPYASITAARVAYKTEDGDRVVQMPNETTQKVPTAYLKNSFIFINDSRASHVQMELGLELGDVFFQIQLNKSPLLEGAVNFRQNPAEDIEALSDIQDEAVHLPNRIFVSEVGNPFVFPPEARQTVGVGSIIGLATTTRALSQGQFGQYPLIAFCSDGIWALDISPTGTYSSMHPISREVCVNGKSICQLDQSVLFATGRGLSRIVESIVTSVSDALDGPLFDVSSKLPVIGSTQFDQGTEALLAMRTHPFTFFREGMLLYDFANSRVIVVSPGVEAAYVFSLRDGTWSTMSIVTPKTVVNAYPYPYLQASNGMLWCLDKRYDYDSPASEYAMVVTRSISFAATMQVIQAFQQLNDCGVVPTLYLHGSNDDITWQYVGHAQRNHAPYLPGHPFRFFRITLYIQMKTYEKYSSLILDVIEKYQKL